MVKYNSSENFSRPLATLETALKIPLKKSRPQALSSAYSLISGELFPLVGRFLARHELEFTVASLSLEHNREYSLIFLAGGKGLHSSGSIPGYILSYIKDLPSCHVFQGFAAPKEDLLFLCEYGYAHPLSLAELVAAATETGLYLSFGKERDRNLLVKPVPEMLSAATIVQYEVDFPLPQYDFVPTAAPGGLSLPLRFVDVAPDAGAPAAVLHLAAAEISWLKELLYRLPSLLFAKIEWIGNRENLFLFFSDPAAISFIPFGQAYKQVADNLFVPADKEIMPRLEPQLLTEIFAGDSQYYTFVNGSRRWDLPVIVRTPLSRLLTTDHDVRVEFRPDLDPVEFAWEHPGLVDESCQQLPEADGSVAESPAIPARARLEEVAVVTSETGSGNSQLINENLNEYAALLRRQGDLLGAATLFSLGRDNLNAADCYAEAARELESKQL